MTREGRWFSASPELAPVPYAGSLRHMVHFLTKTSTMDSLYYSFYSFVMFYSCNAVVDTNFVCLKKCDKLGDWGGCLKADLDQHFLIF